MTRTTQFRSPLLLGFEGMERLLDRLSKTADGYPPYNIERVSLSSDVAQGSEAYRITFAVAGFSVDDLSITLEDRQLVIRGRQTDDETKEYLHRGIAARQFQRSFLIAEGVEVTGAHLDNGLLSVDFVRHAPQPRIERINIAAQNSTAQSRPVAVHSVSSENTERAGGADL